MKRKINKIILVIGLLIGIIVGIIGYGVYKYQAGNYSAEVTKEDKPIFKNLDELQFSFNAYFKAANLEFKLKNKDVEIDNKYNYYKERLQNNLTITAAINKSDNSINNVGAIALSNDSEEVNKNLEEFFSIVIKVATPKNETNVEFIFTELDYKNMKSKPVGTETTIIKNGFKYTLTKNFQEEKMYSLMLVIEKIN